MQQLLRDWILLMETHETQHGDAEQIWIAKYRTALHEIPIQQSRLAKIRAAVDTVWHAAISQVGNLLTSGRKRRGHKDRMPNHGLEGFPPPAQKRAEHKPKDEGAIQNPVEPRQAEQSH